MISAIIAVLAFLQGNSIIPRPPSPSDFAPYGFAGVIFAAFFFLITTVIVLSWRYFIKRDELWVQNQKERDALLKESLSNLGAAHERTFERVAKSAEKAGDAAAAANRETAQALRELQKEVQGTHRFLNEEVLAGILRRALRDVKGELR